MRTTILAIWICLAAAAAAADEVPLYSVFEESFTAGDSYRNPYVELRAAATLLRPDGEKWRIPLFWDGERTWKMRVSPDQPGAWSYTVRSSDSDLDGKQGRFQCVPSGNHGGIMPMRGHPYHFQHQDGTPFWFFGDTAWRAFSIDPAEHLERSDVNHYVDVRAGQGFNYIHTDLTGTGGIVAGVNEEGPMFYDVREEVVNPRYFQAVDTRLRYMNSKGITSGIVLAWGRGYPSWRSFASDEARLRYARYVTARYGAHNVVFIATGEWGYIKDRTDLWRAIGSAISTTDPHGRMVGIHPGVAGAISSETFADDDWCSFGDYQQAYFAPGGREATGEQRDTLHDFFLDTRDHNKPIVHAEYGYFLRDRNGDGKVDKPHSHTRRSFRRVSWTLVMAGGYIVTGFGSTYFGGWRDPGRFNVDDPRNDAVEGDLVRLRDFFTALEWWKLAPRDSLVSAPEGYQYCLADAGRTFVVYTSGTTAARLDPGGTAAAGYSVIRYDPRSGARTRLPDGAGARPITLSSPDKQDWVFLVKATG